MAFCWPDRVAIEICGIDSEQFSLFREVLLSRVYLCVNFEYFTISLKDMTFNCLNKGRV
jgi:hypothetical protein